jgi:hypothetical protein
MLRKAYRSALLPACRAANGVTLNPLRDVPRETVVERIVTISVEDLRGWLKNASYHVRLAVAIAALAPKLRLVNVLALTWPSENSRRRARGANARHAALTKALFAVAGLASAARFRPIASSAISWVASRRRARQDPQRSLPRGS